MPSGAFCLMFLKPQKGWMSSAFYPVVQCDTLTDTQTVAQLLEGTSGLLIVCGNFGSAWLDYWQKQLHALAVAPTSARSSQCFFFSEGLIDYAQRKKYVPQHADPTQVGIHLWVIDHLLLPPLRLKRTKSLIKIWENPNLRQACKHIMAHSNFYQLYMKNEKPSRFFSS